MTDHAHTGEFEQKPRSSKTAPTYFVISAWAVPILAAGDFLVGDVGWYAFVPLALMIYGVATDRAVRPLRWWVGATTALFALPVLIDVGHDATEGLMRDMHPVNLALFALSSLVVLAKVYRSHRR